MSDVTFTAKAYCKIMLHAAKYPHCAVNGVLLSKASGSKTKEIQYVDAIPLFHIAINLTPMAEIALMQIDEMAAKKGLVISGYYAALENLKDCSFEKAHHRIADKIALNFPSPCLVVVDNTKLGTRLEVAQYVDNSFKPLEEHKISFEPDNCIDICSTLLQKNSYKHLVDFDNHLDNLQLDWLNPDLNREIDRTVQSCY